MLSEDAPWMRAPVSAPGGSIYLRMECVEDAAFLRELFKAAATPLLELAPTMAGQLLDMQFRSQAKTYRTNFPQAWSVILELGGQSVGRLLIAQGDPVLVVDYALLPAVQSAGLGGTVLGAVLSRIGLPARATVLETNGACLTMCARLGFHVRGGDPPFRLLEWRPLAGCAREGSLGGTSAS